MVKEVEEVPKAPGTQGNNESADASPQFLSPSPQPSLTRDSSSDRFQVPVTTHSIIAETTIDVSSLVLMVLKSERCSVFRLNNNMVDVELSS